MKIKKYIAEKSSQGFTLIELLVVIGILGILAAGLLATVDPLEQFRKGQDTNRKSAAVEVINGFSRYNAARGVMPWAPAPEGAGCTDPTAAGVAGDALADCCDALIAQGEIKASFTSSQVLDDLTVSSDAANGTLAVCFQPESRSLQQNLIETRYTETGADTCTETDTPNLCFWCAR